MVRERCRTFDSEETRQNSKPASKILIYSNLKKIFSFFLDSIMESVPVLEDCLKLLKGERDEQRLAGLLLATKFCKSEDTASIIRVYDALGVRFLDRLLMTGMGKGVVGDKGEDDHEAYLRLSVTVLAACCRVREIASSKDMVSMVPVMVEILSNSSGTSISEECYEFLLLVAMSSEDGLTKLYWSGVMNALAAHVSTFPDGILWKHPLHARRRFKNFLSTFSQLKVKMNQALSTPSAFCFQCCAKQQWRQKDVGRFIWRT